MPKAESILAWAAAVANDWRGLAIAWHIGLAVVVVAIASGWRPSRRVVASLIVLLVISVALLAVATKNPFNALMFGALAVLLMRATRRFPRTRVGRTSAFWVVSGAGLAALGSSYPHFLVTDTWTAYAYAAPVGLLPCPTLLVVIGLTVIVRGMHSVQWSMPLVVAGVVYGWIGVFNLHVSLDAWLLAGSALLAVLAATELLRERVRATEGEQTRALPGDELIAAPLDTLTHAISVAAAPNTVWPWLVQMGAGSRAGWYSYDSLDNGRQPSATRIVPELQRITVGAVFPALPGVTDGFIVLAFEPERLLVLGWPSPSGPPMVTWAFILEEAPGETTRLMVRVRAREGYRFRQLPTWLSRPVITLVHFVMQRKQLIGVAQRSESLSAPALVPVKG